MSATTPIPELVASLSPDEQNSDVDYIEWLRGTSVFDELSDEDRQVLERRAATTSPDTLVNVADAMSRIRGRRNGTDR